MRWQILIFLLFCLIGVLAFLYYWKIVPERQALEASKTKQISTLQPSDIKSDPSQNTDNLKGPKVKNKLKTLQPEPLSDAESQNSSEDEEPKFPRTAEQEEEEEERIPFDKDPVYLAQRCSIIEDLMPSLSQINGLYSDARRTNGRLKFGQFFCQVTLETIFEGYSFPEKRLKWLRNPETNYPLEIDCFCEELKLGLEFQGNQHGKWPNQFKNMTKKEFIKQWRRDDYKRRKCPLEDVHLMEIWDETKYIKIPSLLADLIPVRFDPYRVDIILIDPDE